MIRKPSPQLSRLFSSVALAVPLALAMSAASAQSPATPITAGNGQQTVTLGDTALTVYTYRPTTCEARSVLLVFHGVDRNPASYREHARPVADRLCAIVVAPLFDQARFPRDLYQYGGIMRKHVAAAPGTRTVDLIPALISWAQRASGQADMPYALLAHSAGSQFLDRVAAFVPLSASRIVLANPSTWVMPDVTTNAPFGFGGMADAATAESTLRAYLALPITVLLGQEDTKSKNLARSPQAEAQGKNRHERGLHAFQAAQETARQHNWPFNWRLVEVPGVGHNASAMFASPQAIEAFSP